MSILQRLSPRLPKSGSSPSSGMAILPSSQKTIPFTVPSTSRSGNGAATASPRKSELLPPGVDCAPTPVHLDKKDELGPPSSSVSSTSLSDAAKSECTTPTKHYRGAHSLGAIDPSLYKVIDIAEEDYDPPDQHIGRVWFAVKYERESEKLLVTVIRAKNLPSRSHGTANSCDPFFKIHLMPDERRNLQSKFKKKTCNPKFEESFVFQVSNKGLEERVLKLTLYDIDRHKRHLVIGHALYPLKEHNYESNERVVIWRDLEREIVESVLERNELHVSLCYNDNLERLLTTVLEAKSLDNDEEAMTADHFVKVCLMHQGKIVKTKRSDTIKKTSNPVFNELFPFKLPSNNLDLASVSITLMQHSSGQKDKCLGRIVLGSFMFARGKELEHWNEMLSHPKEQVSEWHALA